jgi:tetratricopeptide (TPR) repeat protein
LVVARRRNEVLAWALDVLGWPPERLALEVNRVLGVRREIHRTLPYKWRDEDTLPREPLPAIVAAVLSEALGEPLTVQRLWGGRARPSTQWAPADDGMDLPWTQAGTVKLLDVVRSGFMDRRTFLAVAGGSLAGPAAHWLTIEPARLAAVMSGDRVTSQLVDLIDADIAGLRRLDDGPGGAFALQKTDGAFALVTELLSRGSYDTDTGRRLYVAAAELAQLAGFMCFDAGDHPRAQRYYLTALHAAHTASDVQLGAYVLDCMAFQSAWCHRPQEALSLLDSAQRGAVGKVRPRVMAALVAYEARAHAVAGDSRNCSAALNRAESFFDRGRGDGDPSWIYWMDEAIVATGTGQCFAQLGQYRQAEHHLRRGIGLYDESCIRDKAVYLPSLAEVQRAQRDLDGACATARQAMELVPRVNTARATDAVRGLRDRLAADSGVPVVAEFIAEADACLRTA